MKYLLLFLLTFSLQAQTLGVLQIQKNGEGLISVDKAVRLFKAASKASKKFKIPVNVVIAIAMVESSYVLRAVNLKTRDYGIMQINEYHVKHDNLNRDKLLGDLDYSFYHGVRVFSWFYKTYPLNEAIMRYNCGTRKGCTELESVKDYLSKVQGAM